MRSRSARLLAVRRVTQDNQGKKTAGIDGIKSVEPAQKACAGRSHSPQTAPEAESQAGPPGLDPQTWQAGKAPAGHSRPCTTEPARPWPNWHWSQNGKPALNPTAMGFDQDADAMTPSERSLLSSSTRTNTSWTPTSAVALSTGARSGGRPWGCEQPVSQMEWLIPYPFRPVALTQQGAQVTKADDKPCAHR